VIACSIGEVNPRVIPHGQRCARSITSIEIEPASVQFRLVGEESIPALYNPEMFEVVSPTIPPTWVVTSPRPGCLCLGPSAWARPSFWEEFYDGHREARECFEKERLEILAADP